LDKVPTTPWSKRHPSWRNPSRTSAYDAGRRRRHVGRRAHAWPRNGRACGHAVSGGALKAAGWSSSTADTLDPAKASLSTDYVRCCAFYNRLTFLDKGGAADGTCRSDREQGCQGLDGQAASGVTFHDGKPLTATTSSFAEAPSRPSVGSKVAKIAAQMTGFKAVDKQTVEITLANANADLPTILSHASFHDRRRRHDRLLQGQWHRRLRAEVFEPGVRSVGLKNKNYWKSAARMSILSNTSPSATTMPASTPCLSGDIHLAAIDQSALDALVESQRRLRTVEDHLRQLYQPQHAAGHGARQQADFVEGMKYLINREQIVRNRRCAVSARSATTSPFRRRTSTTMPT
jgi:peptide/nickel transport system substrate-binding protein